MLDGTRTSIRTASHKGPERKRLTIVEYMSYPASSHHISADRNYHNLSPVNKPIIDFPKPLTLNTLLNFLGNINWLSPWLPKLTSQFQPLFDLLKGKKCLSLFSGKMPPWPIMIQNNQSNSFYLNHSPQQSEPYPVSEDLRMSPCTRMGRSLTIKWDWHFCQHGKERKIMDFTHHREGT